MAHSLSPFFKDFILSKVKDHPFLDLQLQCWPITLDVGEAEKFRDSQNPEAPFCADFKQTLPSRGSVDLLHQLDS